MIDSVRYIPRISKSNTHSITHHEDGNSWKKKAENVEKFIRLYKILSILFLFYFSKVHISMTMCIRVWILLEISVYVLCLFWIIPWSSIDFSSLHMIHAYLSHCYFHPYQSHLFLLAPKKTRFFFFFLLPFLINLLNLFASKFFPSSSRGKLIFFSSFILGTTEIITAKQLLLIL